jgi:hypothetical protein
MTPLGYVTVLRLLHLPLARYGIWPHLHRSCGHLPSLAKTFISAAMLKFAPPLRLSKPSPAISGIIIRALAAPHFHNCIPKYCSWLAILPYDPNSQPKPSQIKRQSR